MNTVKKEEYVRPELVVHELLRDITAESSCPPAPPSMLLRAKRYGGGRPV